nr:MAG TPA: hypothetical protein [Caudoviricetes sp.]
MWLSPYLNLCLVHLLELSDKIVQEVEQWILEMKSQGK